MNTELRWIVSRSTNCLHASNVLCEGGRLADTQLAQYLAEPAAALSQELARWGLDQRQFWQHIVPLSAGIDDNRQLIDVVLRKILGPDKRSPNMIDALIRRVRDVEAADQEGLSNKTRAIRRRTSAWKRRWADSGAALLTHLGWMTDENVLVPNADVMLVDSVVGGAGYAYLLYNSVLVEAIDVPQPELPEVLRLAWLLGQLNIDLPTNSDHINTHRLPMVARMAMLPATLAAGERLRLCRLDQATVERAVRAWHVGCDSEPEPRLPEILLSWWNTYTDTNPRWSVALTAMDRLIGKQTAQLV